MRKKAVKKNHYLTTGEVADILGVSLKTAKRWMIREGVARKHGARWKTSRAQLLSAFPELIRDVAD